jgi:hypothetical protein
VPRRRVRNARRRGAGGKKIVALAVAALALVGGGAAGYLAIRGWLAPAVSAERVNDAGVPIFAGIDLRDYPGDAAMRRLRKSYRFTGYYLVSPNHPGDSWNGRWRSSLRAMEWGVAVLYVGQQVGDLTDEQGRIDGRDAVARAAAEGFPDGAVIYLDVEHHDEVDEDLSTYVATWVKEVAADAKHKMRPGIYCHVANAKALRAVAGDVPYWVSGGSDFSLDRAPAASGISFATAWQGWLDVEDPAGAIGRTVDVSVSTSASPSF